MKKFASKFDIDYIMLAVCKRSIERQSVLHWIWCAFV